MTGTDVRAGSCGYLLNQQTLISQAGALAISNELGLLVSTGL